jgi:hydrogenase-4 component F
MMPLPWMTVFFPWVGALVLLALPRLRMAAAVNIGCAAISFLLAIALFTLPHGEQGWTRIDALNLPFVLLAAFVALTTSIFSAAVIAGDIWRFFRIIWVCCGWR